MILSQMISSMTGYAAASADTGRGTLGIELRSVNGRFLDLSLRVAEELRALEPMLRETITARVARGKVDCRVFLLQSSAQSPERLDAAALARLRALAEEAARAFPGAAPLRIADVLRWPGVVAAAPAEEDALRPVAERLCGQALDELVAARRARARSSPPRWPSASRRCAGASTMWRRWCRSRLPFTRPN